ncbi:MAG: hypothetical protein HY242_17630 [Afipia sp.]|nr:hypothetical protein [Afipia sp.]
MKKIFGAAIFSFLASTGIAVSAPQSFYGKTLKVTWNETRSQRVHGEGEFQNRSVPLSFTVYVSSKGQLFRRLTSSSSKTTGSTDRVGDSTAGSQGAGTIAFQGNTMIYTANNGGLGRRVRVTFDGGSSCSAEILTGTSGSQTVRSNATGKMMDVQSVSAGAASCSVQDGNAFAG